MGIINTIKTTLNGINGATWINNVKIEGAQTISINNGKIYVNGNLREGLESPSIEVKIEGNVASVRTDSGDVSTVNTTSGDVSCKDVKGGVLTMSGDVTCGNVGGNVSTMSGNIYHN
jgi:hypothetical protein